MVARPNARANRRAINMAAQEQAHGAAGSATCEVARTYPTVTLENPRSPACATADAASRPTHHRRRRPRATFSSGGGSGRCASRSAPPHGRSPPAPFGEPLETAFDAGQIRLTEESTGVSDEGWCHCRHVPVLRDGAFQSKPCDLAA